MKSEQTIHCTQQNEKKNSCPLDKTMYIDKERAVIFGDVMDRREFYTSVFLGLFVIIFLVVAIASIIYPQSIWFVLAALSPLFICIFFIFPFIIVPSILKYLSVIVGRLYDNIGEVRVTDCPKNGKIIKIKDYMDDKIATKITSILEALILILMIIYFALAIYYGIPIGDSSMI
ncbi:hypothetical protein [Methanosarcina sp. 1.H.T.1A.1]|uniref:hypothetical protein n=1 Tax=Methanosarcina sp. 1.H.T.1A.1 TaxID=1483602 RepID=UPI0012E085B0|nr:hypothetical protein [Methanosarcina sp. 1.H.T.1A.1]